MTSQAQRLELASKQVEPLAQDVIARLFQLGFTSRGVRVWLTRQVNSSPLIIDNEKAVGEQRKTSATANAERLWRMYLLLPGFADRVNDKLRADMSASTNTINGCVLLDRIKRYDLTLAELAACKTIFPDEKCQQSISCLAVALFSRSSKPVNAHQEVSHFCSNSTCSIHIVWESPFSKNLSRIQRICPSQYFWNLRSA